MHSEGVTYDTVILESTGFDIDKLYQAEVWWIAYGRCLGWCLTNHTLGGEGQKGWVPTTETKAKISASLKGRSLSEETKSKLSKARTGRRVSQETRDKIRQAKLGKKHTQESRIKMSASVKAHYANHGGRLQSAEEIEKRRLSLFGNTRAVGKRWKRNPETIAKIKAAQQLRRARERGTL